MNKRIHAEYGLELDTYVAMESAGDGADAIVCERNYIKFDTGILTIHSFAESETAENVFNHGSRARTKSSNRSLHRQPSRQICHLSASAAVSVLSHLMQQNYAPSRPQCWQKPLRVSWPLGRRA
jgi:3-oxoacyl-[acyl-carrier-protein] synthase III